MKLRILLGTLAAAMLMQACVPLVVGGIAGGVVSAIDRRTYKEQFRDAEIERTFNYNFAKELEAKTAVSASAFNGWVLLTGQAIDEQARGEVEALVRRVPNVRQIFNEITIGYPASFSSRANDRLLASNLRARLINEKDLASIQVKLTVVGSTAYLMGMLTEAETRVAIAVARSTSGIQKVVSMVETISPEVAKQRDLHSEQAPAGKP